MARHKVEASNKLMAAAAMAPNTDKRERITKFADEIRDTKHTGAAFDKRYGRLLDKTFTMTKQKVERGDGKTFSSRTHHCEVCHKAYGAVCARKGHMEQCPQHNDVRSKKGTDCTTCDEVEASNARREREQERDREAKGKKQNKFASGLTAFLSRSGKDRKERHKKADPESSEGHGVLEGLMGAVHL